MNRIKVRHNAFEFLSEFGGNIKTKLNNVCAKTGQYSVPSELFQKRTPRSNRVLITWKTVKNNNLSLEQLNAFEGGVAVELLNNDFFDEDNYTNPLFIEIVNRLGSNDNISSIISIRSEGGSSSSSIQRKSFLKLVNNKEITYKGNKIIITNNNYMEYKIKQLKSGGTGNEKWDGFLFVSIKGGQQDTIETHHDEQLTIFNPACEYASHQIRIDIDLVVAYFMFYSIDKFSLDNKTLTNYNRIINELKFALKEAYYDYPSFKGNLLEYCNNHICMKLFPGKLTDPIQLKNISIDSFNTENRIQDSIDFTHNEAVNIERFYWDEIHKTILSPARPSNIFWSYHLSNMMQQDYTLDEYFRCEKERYEKRQQLLKK